MYKLVWGHTLFVFIQKVEVCRRILLWLTGSLTLNQKVDTITLLFITEVKANKVYESEYNSTKLLLLYILIFPRVAHTSTHDWGIHTSDCCSVACIDHSFSVFLRDTSSLLFMLTFVHINTNWTNLCMGTKEKQVLWGCLAIQSKWLIISGTAFKQSTSTHRIGKDKDDSLERKNVQQECALN